ncbi:hypothetical protein ACLESD_40300 [Pyxidicoccus sp. 3LFB2]
MRGHVVTQGALQGGEERGRNVLAPPYERFDYDILKPLADE